MANLTDNTSKKISVNTSRRDFLSKTAVAGTVTLAPGVLLHSAAQGCHRHNNR